MEGVYVGYAHWGFKIITFQETSELLQRRLTVMVAQKMYCGDDRWRKKGLGHINNKKTVLPWG